MIDFYNEDIEMPALDLSSVKEWINTIVDRNDKLTGDVSFIFCSDAYLLKINQEYLNHNYFTDIITFNYNEGSKISGDIFISLDTVKANAIEYDVTFDNELYRVIIHGILHLIGFNDKTDDEQALMTSKENEALNILDL